MIWSLLAPVRRPHNYPQNWFMNAKVIGIFLLLVVLCVFMSIFVPEKFLAGNNIENLMKRTALYGILGIGVAFVIISSGIDLSIGSVVCLSACLLAVFLHVEYVPFDSQDVLAVRAAEREVVLQGEVDLFKQGDMLRYDGGRRARSEVLQVLAVESREFETTTGGTVTTTVVKVDKNFSRDDSLGRVALAYPVNGYSVEDVGSKAEIQGSHARLKKRDRLTLVHADGRIETQPVVKTETSEQGSSIWLEKPAAAKVDDQWFAVPLQRHQRMPILAAISLVMVIGLGLGTIHGILVTKVGLQPFVVTLCGLLIYRGISRWLTDDQVVGFLNEYDTTLRPWIKSEVILFSNEQTSFGIPYPFFILIFTTIVAAVFLNRTIWGRYLQALGRNNDAAKYSGIQTDRVTIMAYVICTGLAALGGMLFALDYNQVPPSSFGNFYELYAIAAAVLGGCSLRGGDGAIFGVVIGTAVMQTLNNLIVLLKISDELELAIIGAVILCGVMADVALKFFVDRRRTVLQARQAAAG